MAPTLREMKLRRDKLGPEPEQPRSSFLEWNYEAELFAFGKRLGEEFDRNLLRKALTQREYANLQEFKAQESGTNITEFLIFLSQPINYCKIFCIHTLDY